MIQTEVYLKGQYDYSKISGPTGPLVYVDLHDLRAEMNSDARTDILLATFGFTTCYISSPTLERM